MTISMTRFKWAASATILCLAATPATAPAGVFTAGDLAIYRVGGSTANPVTNPGSSGLLNTGAQVFIDEYAPDGTWVQAIALPSTGGGVKLVASGTGTSEGLLTLSPDGSTLALTGYNSTIPASGSISGTSAERTVATINSAGSASLYSFTDFSTGNNPRSAIVSGNNLWMVGGTGGVEYKDLTGVSSGTAGLTGTAVSTNQPNNRSLGIAGGQLYDSSGSGTNTNRGVNAIGNGLPTSGTNAETRIPGLTDASNPSTYQFFFADLEPTKGVDGTSATNGVDTLYIADDGTGALTKFSFTGAGAGTTWSSNGMVGADADDYRGLTGSVSGGAVTLFAIRKGGSGAAGGGEFVKLADASGYNGAFSGTPTLLASLSAATTNEAWRGIAFVPAAVPEASAAALGALAGCLAVGASVRRRSTRSRSRFV